MLNPHKLSQMTWPDIGPNQFIITWPLENDPCRGAYPNIRGAWELDEMGYQYPVPMHPSYLHPRMIAQRSCFTIHGKRKESLCEIVDVAHLKKYVIDTSQSQHLVAELRILGIADFNVFPDLEGLAKDIARMP